VHRSAVSIALIVLLSGALAAPASAANKKSTFAVSASNTGNCTVRATATWSGARVSAVDYVLTVETQRYTPEDVLKKPARNGTSTIDITTENAGNATVDATFLRGKAVAGTATSSAFTVACT
jgi:hypothetical protein